MGQPEAVAVQVGEASCTAAKPDRKLDLQAAGTAVAAAAAAAAALGTAAASRSLQQQACLPVAHTPGSEEVVMEAAPEAGAAGAKAATSRSRLPKVPGCGIKIK
jgi:hypothetical protein